ncbi:membrane protein [Nocardioides ginsengisegetis]|uniref:Membrane protein n=1 Tax=Nocardioides ginsengisegetis TaxID=661491 RepID=A0A7W3IX92_9ACTN|nr:YihY/virulence factor BrkB family protein [Nocardioides ginsengisegetis]MBA8802234.1 membrane protein [Nocardioides ginsengisegetis]
MASLKERATARLAELRRRRPSVDHAVRMQQHYGAVKAGQQAGAVTYFGFLSFFPILALAVFVVGYVSWVYPAANHNLRDAIESVLPGLIGDQKGQISLANIRTFSGWAGLVGVLGVLYSGLGWVSALRDALTVVFELPAKQQPGFVRGKARDLLTLVAIGLVLLVTVAVAGFARGFSGNLLDWLGLGTELGWLVGLVTVVLGLAANTLLFFLMFKLLAEPPTPSRSLWRGALLGAVLFEVLKQASQYLLASTKGQPAFQAFGIALILLVWINYFSRVVLYAAAFAHTTPEARAQRVADPAEPVQGPPSPPVTVDHVPQEATMAAPGRSWVGPFAAGSVTALGLVAALRKKDS